MGDRVQVRVVILESQKEAFESLCDYFTSVAFAAAPVPDNVLLLEYVIDDIDEAVLDNQSKLHDLNIAYSKYWDAGDQFVAGEEHYRIDEAGNDSFTLFDVGVRNRVDLQDVCNAVAGGVIDEYIQTMEEKFYVLPWVEQEAILKELT